MRVWITKYALTEGIQEMDGEITNTSPDLIGVRPKTDVGFTQYFHVEGREWHRSHDAALVRAETMRQAKIKSVKKQLERLERMTF